MSLDLLLQQMSDPSTLSWKDETYDLALARGLTPSERATYVAKLIDNAKQGDAHAILTLGHLNATEALSGLQADAKSGEPWAGTATATAACVEGAWQDPSGTYCVKVPEGYTPPTESKKDADRTSDRFETEEAVGNFGIKVWTSESASFDNLKASHMTDGNGSKIVESGEFASGNGWYVKARREADKETYTSSVLKAGDKVIECEAMASDDKPLEPEDACKTLRAM